MTDKTRLHILLEELAEEVPPTMDIWPRIRAKTQSQKKERFSFVGRPRSMVALACLILILAGTAYAAYQVVTQSFDDRGIKSVADLLTPLDLTKSLPDADVNVTLLWAYADGHRISIAYKIDNDISLYIPNFVDATVTDANGTVYPNADFLQTGGGGGGGDAQRNYKTSTLSFDATGITDTPDKLDLHVVIHVREPKEGDAWFGGGGGGSGGGGGGGGGGEVTEEPPHRVIDPFDVAFDFSVPFHPRRIFDQTLTQSANGIAMTLSHISYSPSITLARLCYTAQTDYDDWNPTLMMLEGDQPQQNGEFKPDDLVRQNGGFRADEQQTSKDEICGDVTIFKPIMDNHALTIIVPSLERNLSFNPERAKAFKDEAAKHGFNVDVSADGGYGINFTPEELQKWDYDQQLDYYDVLLVIYGSVFSEHKEGPWQFVIPLS